MHTQRIRHIARKRDADKDLREEIAALGQADKAVEMFPTVSGVAEEQEPSLTDAKINETLLGVLGEHFNVDPVDESAVLQAVQEWAKQQRDELLNAQRQITAALGIPMPNQTPDFDDMSKKEFSDYTKRIAGHGSKLVTFEP